MIVSLLLFYVGIYICVNILYFVLCGLYIKKIIQTKRVHDLIINSIMYIHDYDGVDLDE